ncbi:MAG: hypothetical protein ETSY2_07610, partial [Candidatus Entotheonella gemina]
PDGAHLKHEFEDVFRNETLARLKLATRGRLVSLAVVSVLVLFLVPRPAVYYYHILIALFALLGILLYRLNRKGPRAWVMDGFIALDFAMLTYTLFSPNPLDTSEIPLQSRFRYDPIVYYFMLLSMAAFTFSPRRMLVAGISAGLSWTAGVFWLVALPGTVTPWNHPPNLTPEQDYIVHLGPLFVDTHMWMQNLIILLLVSGILAFVVQRSQQLVIRQATVTRQRASLSRYFSPNVLDEVMDSAGPLTTVRKYDVAILFADIVGFTRLCETMPPENVMDLLRNYHSRLEAEVFRFGGTLDKFIGDAVMASFGAPQPGPQDATQSLRCAQAMLKTMADWNAERERVGEVPIRIGIGIHYGPAVMGDVGSERCAAFAVIGDTTNTTSRLQSLTRSLDAEIVASQTLMDAVQRESPDEKALFDSFEDAGWQTIRGRQNAMHVRVLRGVTSEIGITGISELS